MSAAEPIIIEDDEGDRNMVEAPTPPGKAEADDSKSAVPKAEQPAPIIATSQPEEPPHQPQQQQEPPHHPQPEEHKHNWQPEEPPHHPQPGAEPMQEGTDEPPNGLMGATGVARHEVLGADDSYIPPTAEEMYIGKPAKVYPFELDDFQKKAIACLERGENVLVAAHTSAGKTVIAEYAIAKALGEKQRVVYTSPIKALSNQKFRELNEEFSDVGLMTGDVTLNREASCLVMTTEILRNMMYRGSTTLREVAFVIFDEVHYMRDRERGVVWEELIILLNRDINLVFLSATLSNARDFASWVAWLKDRPCHLVATDVRPVPLQHYIFPCGGSGLFLVKDGEDPVMQNRFNDAVQQIKDIVDSHKQKNRGPKRNRVDEVGKGDCQKLIHLLQKRSNLPVIVFSFSRLECEHRAIECAKVNLNSAEESAMVEEVYENAIDQLTEEDRLIPQVRLLLPMIKRGVAVHHSGLLPILKEVVELLFQEQLIKALFATETFAMGVNMPAKTVVFTALTKYDGTEVRCLKSGEYIQMSGRAGRRGKDEKGLCILMMDEYIDEDSVSDMLSGESLPLVSSFHLRYNMVLNLMRVDFSNPEEVVSRSFLQFEWERTHPKRTGEIEEAEQKQKKLNEEDEEIAKEHCDLLDVKNHIEAQLITSSIENPESLLSFLTLGRLVFLANDSTEYGWGAVVNCRKRFAPNVYYIDVLLPIKGIQKSGKINEPIPCINFDDPALTATSHVKFVTIRVLLKMIKKVSSVRVFIYPNIKEDSSRRRTYQNVVKAREFYRKKGESLPLLDPVKDLHVDQSMKNNEVATLMERLKSLNERLKETKLAKLPQKKSEELLGDYKLKLMLEKRLVEMKKFAKASHVSQFKEELKSRLKVLKRLGHITVENVLQLKGRVACEVESVDELIVTELIFDGVFSDATPAETVALASCLLEHEKCNTEEVLHPRLSTLFQKVRDAASKVLKVQKDCRIDVGDEEMFMDRFKDDVMCAVYAWCEGDSFSKVAAMTDMFEGSLVRLIRRIHEVLLQLEESARSIGNDTLEDKFKESINCVKRGIVFSASLYID